ncbi:hypothetical protein [Halopseudomonas sp.]|uniref:hypothetical protein n=1 Tax=Halopseudomonas sp. TaxID=2901191 RepID=UPI003001CB42
MLLLDAEKLLHHGGVLVGGGFIFFHRMYSLFINSEWHGQNSVWQLCLARAQNGSKVIMLTRAAAGGAPIFPAIRAVTRSRHQAGQPWSQECVACSVNGRLFSSINEVTHVAL